MSAKSWLISLQDYSQLPLKGHGRQREIPKRQKKPNLTPIFNRELWNYNLVNLTLNAKKLEYIPLYMFSKHTTDKKVIESNQNGLTVEKCCLTNLITYDDLTGLNEGTAVDVVYLDPADVHPASLLMIQN